MTHSRSYYTLVASLPALPSRFDAGRVPISWPTLRDRLRMLELPDAKVTRQIGRFFLWARQTLDETDSQVIERYHELMRHTPNSLVRHLIHSRTESRLLISAVRRQRMGLGPPDWSLRAGADDPLVSHLRTNWSEPNFNLGVRHRWLEAFIKHYDQGDMRMAQWVTFNERWRDWTRIAERYNFTFEAVIVYLVRWEIVDRWTSQNAEVGKARFANLIKETLGEYAESR